jgi:soluble lytic murein transglycosylase-like protein
MKKPTLLVFALLAAIPAFSQDRPRFFDNFDTSRGVQVVRNDFVPVGARPKPLAMKSGKKLISKTAQATAANHQKPLVSPSSISRMNVSEGLADRELFRPVGYSGPSMSANNGMKGFTTGNALYDSYIVDSSRRYGIDPLLIYAQMHQESSFKLKALSHKGASGLMQLMPATARRLGVTNIYDPKQNIEGGVKYMRMLLDMFGQDVNLALAGYNAGEGAVMKYGRNIPPYNETREYVRRISARYASISDGTYARNYKRVNNTVAQRMEKKESRPLTVYEPAPVAIRLADGRMRLVNQ